MLRATADIKLPTAIIGSLPRPNWYTENLGSRNFLAAMVNARYREQYIDALAAHITEQQLAGLDILTDGRAGAGHQHRAPRARPPRSPMPRRRRSLFPGRAGKVA